MTPFFRNHLKIYKEDTYANHFRHVPSTALTSDDLDTQMTPVQIMLLVAVAELVRAQVSKSRGPGFESHRRRFESWASSFTPRCLSL